MRNKLHPLLLIFCVLVIGSCKSVEDREFAKCIEDSRDAFRVANPGKDIDAKEREKIEDMCIKIKNSIID